VKKLFRASVFIGIFIFLMACKLFSQATPSPVASPVKTSTSTAASIPRRTATSTLEDLPTLSYNPPTLFPTFDPTSVPKVLSEAFSLKTMEGVNDHTIQQVTGWEYGFRQNGPGRQPCNGYQWLDSNHLLLYPRTGEGMVPYGDGSTRADLSSQLVIINLENGVSWLPRNGMFMPSPGCGSVLWSQDLGIIINQGNLNTNYASKEGVTTYTFDGQRVAEYWGRILGISPSGKKILVDDDTIIDLRTGKITDLAWYMDYDFGLFSKLYWSSDETRLYRCCFYYADLETGRSYNLEWSDLRGVDGKAISFTLKSPHVGGQWVRNDTYFFPMWDYMSYAGDPTVMFSPTEKKFYGVPMPSGVRADTTTYTISPDGMYVWIKGYGDDGLYHGFLLNLTSLKTVSSDMAVDEFNWSQDSKYAWITIYDESNKYVISTAGKSTLFPVKPISVPSWHPKDHVLAYLAENDQSLALLNAKDMTVQGWKLPTSVIGFLWNLNGDRIVFISTDGSLWQVDYPKFQNFEQLTGPMSDVRDVFWSPDGNSIALVSGADLYIVDTTK